MGLVAASLKSDLLSIYSVFNPDPITVGVKTADAYKNYVTQGMNAGGFPVSAIPAIVSAGQAIGNIYKDQLPSGAVVGTKIATEFNNAATSIMSANQLSIVATPAALIPKLISLYSTYSTSGAEFANKLGDALDQWTKTFVVSGLIPAVPPIPFSGPLS
jgi:hypothetical protein